MPHRFVSQPNVGGFDLLDFAQQVAGDTEIDRLDFVVAWAKRTGLDALRPAFDAFRRRGGRIRGIVGISQGGTSRQALELLSRRIDEPYVFHAPGHTFHPKLYVARGSTRALALVGSHNLTRGGARTNFEAGIYSVLNMDNAEDRSFLLSVDDYIQDLLAERNACLHLTETKAREIISNSRYNLSDEDAEDQGREGGIEDDPSGEEGYGAGSGDPELFGPLLHELRSPPRTVSPDRRTPPGIIALSSSSRSAAAMPAVVKRWYKLLKRADAQQLPTSHPSNTMTLVAAGHPVDRETYFRHEFFGDRIWTSSVTSGDGRPRDVATVACDVVVDGVDWGVQEFELRHTPGYASDEGNRLTELVWKDFGRYLQEHNLAGRVATIEKYADGSYRLVIGRSETGPFLL